MRLLGIDYGEKRIGIALSDQDKRMAFPHSVVDNKGFALIAKEIKKIIKKENVGGIVMGLSINFHKKENPIMKNAREFASILEKETKLKVVFENEMFTSALAERIQGKNKMIDASAATLILESYLGKINGSHQV